MFRSKKDVDRHVQNVFSKLRNENEKDLRCYNVAKLYYQVGDYESTKRYVSNYLGVRDGSASAHKLLGQAYEALGQKEAAFNEYKISLELEGRQDDLVLKVCELLADLDIGMDVNKVEYWVDRADRQFPHHPVVFQLKEKLLTIKRPNNSTEDFEKLIKSELIARPNDVQLPIKLLNHYMLERKFDKAYEYAVSVEADVRHRNSIVWYQLLYELLTKCKETKSFDWSFWFLYISVSDRYAALCLKEQGSDIKKSISEATQAVFNFDQNLYEMELKNFSKQHAFTEHLFTHMWGQLHFHLACLLLRKTKREQGSWSEAGRLCAPLLLIALHMTPLEMRTSIHLEDDASKNQLNIWIKEAAYRCCQAGYILQNYARDDTKKLLDRIDKFCTGLWRERIYQRIFVTRTHLDHMQSSFFCNYSASDPPLRFCTASQLRHYSQIAQEVWPSSLHHQIWFGMENRPQHKDAPYPDQYSRVFPSLQFSVFNTNQAAPDTLCLLDIDAFLNAAILCSSAVLEEQQLGSFINPERLPTLPVDLTATLSTSNQEKWWSAAYKMCSKRQDVDSDIGELRQELQQGLEVVRCIGNHGMHPVLLVHLARMFHYRAKMMKEKDAENGYIPRWETRSELYWTAVIPLLERLQNNQTLRMSSSKLFNYQGKEMNNFELTNALEEGKLLLAQRLVRDKQYEQAIDALQALKCPEASFQQAQIYKMFADEIVNSTPRESLTSEMRSQHVIMLTKARNCFYLTLDRLRSPGTNPKHPLNAELGTHITDIENELKRIDPDLGRGDLSRNDIDNISDESYSPTHSAVDHAVTNPTLLTTLPVGNNSNMLSTPQRNAHRTPRHASTPCRLQYQDYLNLSKNRTEARPSPERLDAQIRQIIQSRDNEMQELMEQMKNMTIQIKTLNEKVETLTKEVVESRKENQKQQQQQQQQRVQQQNVNPAVDPDDFYVLDDDEYADLSYQNQPTGPASSISGNIFASQHARHPYSSLVYPSAAAAAAFQGWNYQSGIPFTDPNAQAAISSLYPHTVYPMPVLYPNQSKVPDNPLQQGLFASTLSSQLPDLMPAAAATNPSLQMQPLQQKIETPRTKPETTITTTTTIIKDAPVNKAPPVNVVITTSDTLPTTVPSIQPTLSVTIPPQYRLGGGAVVTFSTPITTAITVTIATASTTMTTKSSSSSNAPHCYQIAMPSQATIPTTVNLPPTTIYVTPTNINISPMYANLTTSSTPSTVTTNTTFSNTLLNTLLNAQNNATNIKTLDKADNIAKPIYEPIESPNTSAEISEQEHDPIPDFVPVIPLPAKVKVTTGEEDEDTLYCSRAKLFRFVDKEWKERGVGYVKLLRNLEGKVRLLMRRDQILKICANHMLRPDMELTPMSNNNKALFWVANDFADEEVKLEKLCIKFKTAEEAMAFKEAFDQAKFSLIATSSEKIADKTSSNDLSQIHKAQLQPAKIIPTTEAASDKSKSGTTTLGGFSFSSKPIIQEVKDAEVIDSKKSEEAPKVSPFSGFTFKSHNKSEIAKITTTVTSTSTQSAKFLFSTSASISQSSDLSLTPNASPIFTSPATSGQNSTALRRPRLPPPGAIKSGINEEIQPQSENEWKLFNGTASLQCQCSSNSKWKNKGTGPIILLLDTKSGKIRLLLTDDKSSKVYGHGIPLDMAFTYKNGTTVVNWTVPGDIKEPGKTWSLHAATFNTSELASQFYNIISSCQQKLAKGCNPNEVAKELEKKASSSDNKDQNVQVKPHSASLLSQLFKPPVGSWECSSCYIRNKATDMKCVACNALSPSSTASHKSSSTIANSKPIDSDKLPLAELFKSPSGSWTCPNCHITNFSTNIYCVACDKPKDPSQPPKPQQTNIFQVSSSNASPPKTKFSFGIPKDAAKEATDTGFSFRMLKTEDNKSAVDSTKTANFVFGMPVKTTTNSGDSPFTFGSPTKSFGFNFAAKSPAKSPGGAGGETSEDEVVESDDVHFSPVIPLPDKIEVKTGEENEEVLYSHRAKLFRFDTTVKEWKERGLGDIKLLRHKETGKLRLIMRRDHVLKLCLNHHLSGELEFTPKDEKTWLWTTADYSDGEIEYMQFACRFKTSEIATNFKKVIDDARKNVISNLSLTSSKSEKVDKSATIKTPTQTNCLPVEEVEIIYETKVTSEEKAAALELQLPENFYAYKQKEDCPGCRGCRKPSIVLYPDVATTQDSTSWKPTSEEKTIILPKLAPSVSGDSKSIDTTQNATQPTSVKNGFSFTTLTPTTFMSPSTTSSIFDSSAMSFGTGDLKLFNDKKTTTFSFGMNLQFSNSETATSTSLENVKICSPSNVETAQTTTSNTAVQSIFGQTTSTASIFKTPTFNLDTGKNIFGSATNATLSKTSIFGGNSDGNSFNAAKTTSTAATTTNSIPKTSSSTITTTMGTGSSFGTGLFGSAITQPTTKANDTITAATSAVNLSNNSVFNTNTTFSKMTFGASSFGNSTMTTSIFNTTPAMMTNLFNSPPSTMATNIFNAPPATMTTNIFSTSPATTTSNVFETKQSDNTQKNDDGPFFSKNTVSFTALASAAAKPEAFKVDPNFSFAGAGSAVFGSKSTTSSSLNSSASVQNKSQDSTQKEDNEEDDGEVDNEQEHDPHFEPIVPLPDAIEVRTGEEDEEKVFCNRAKLYRYDNATKEWKERGVGEMKILYHAGHGSYRLLLRREQVHKVVCNFLVTPDVEFRPLSTSHQAWMWAGMNYAEQEPCAEQLAVKFKSPDLAQQFKAHIDKIQQELHEKKNTQGERCVGEVEESEEHDRNDANEAEDDEEEDEEDDQEMILIIEKRATVFARWPNETKWEIVGLGNLAIHYDSEIYAERILLKLDDSEEYASNTIISMDSEMQVEGKECIWSGIDYALDPPVRRVLKAVFSSIQAAQEIHTFFEDGVESAKQVGVAEYQEEDLGS
ncbi:E3 SUMO-protein ligase RanBP2 [Camponotus floridanus]|uniref:E3 SUMO-protein ligase RanBP2 n=1 Tax=Camponotus floridanus TaxID=104421 RepID=E2ARH2_CAMFO|nr:E3 SUMO-protein ligase RanBP2 [Camponotus floridanus]EFN63981.1 E3 SUMO-protein ligase RanBP2 [Camponotus floridanus]